MTPIRLIEELAQALQITTPRPAEDGRYHLHFDKDLDIALLPIGSQRLMMTASVGSWPQEEDTASRLAQHLLRINLARASRNSEVLCLHGDELCLYQLIQTFNLDFSLFTDKLTSFLNHLETWRSDYEHQASFAVPVALPMGAAIFP